MESASVVAVVPETAKKKHLFIVLSYNEVRDSALPAAMVWGKTGDTQGWVPVAKQATGPYQSARLMESSEAAVVVTEAKRFAQEGSRWRYLILPAKE